MISAMHLDQMEERAKRLDPDEMRETAADVEYLAAEVRRLQSVVDSVQEIIDGRMNASHNYYMEATMGRISRKYGYRMASKLKSEANELRRVLK